MIAASELTTRSRGARHDHMLTRFSVAPMRIVALRRLGVERDEAVRVIRLVCDAFATQAPSTTFHAGRGPHTGYTQMPLERAMATAKSTDIGAWQPANGKPWPRLGMIRLGDPSSLGTIAHELGHHLVNQHEPLRTAPHGKRWVHWFDAAAEVIERHTR